MRRLSCLVLLLVGTACVVRNEPIALYQQDVSAAKPRIGVLPLVDARPEVQHLGQSPRLIPLLVWNQRIGAYVTGDEDFTDSVPEAVTKTVARALQSSFGEAAVLSGDPDADAACASGLAYVASGTIEEFYGTRYQRSYFFLPVFVVGYSLDPGEPILSRDE